MLLRFQLSPKRSLPEQVSAKNIFLSAAPSKVRYARADPYPLIFTCLKYQS
jgi:hypothetical protein